MSDRLIAFRTKAENEKLVEIDDLLAAHVGADGSYGFLTQHIAYLRKLLDERDSVFADMREDGTVSLLEMAELKFLLARFMGQKDEGPCETKGGFCYIHDFDDEEGQPCPVRRSRELLKGET